MGDITRSIWERIIYGPDSNEPRPRSASVSSSKLASPIDPALLAKDEAAVKTREKDLSPEPSREKPLERPSWNPSIFQPRPVAGIGSLCLAAFCVFASLAILLASDGQPVDRWSISPTVYLAIVAAIANSAVRVGHFHAVPVSWWYHASKGGSIRALERHWEINNSVGRALFYARHLSLLNLACIAVSLAVIDGPFLQRASTVVLTRQTTNVTLNILLPAELPTGFSGYYQHHVLTPTPETNATSVEFLHHDAIRLNVSGCDGRVSMNSPQLQT